MMRELGNRWALAAMVAGAVGLAQTAQAQVLITDFSNFNLDGAFASWGTATIVSGPTSYEITSMGGYGSGYEDINPNINAAGATDVELKVSIVGAPSGPTAGPIVSLVDGDGTFVNYAWYGQPSGTHTLTMSLLTPSWVTSAGGVPGLDLTTLDFFHLQNDPGSYTGPYQITFDNLQLNSVIPEPATAALGALALAGMIVARRRRS